MEKHFGETVENLVRKNGYSLTELSRQLNVNRRTLYNWFDQKTLRPEYIIRIGHIIKHDFSKEFPELMKSEEFDIFQLPKKETVAASEDLFWKDKYIRLLEQYHSFCADFPIAYGNR